MNFQAHKLMVSNPCSQDWNSMKPIGNSRFCEDCKKSVIDFSKMSDEEIESFFIANLNTPICGRFKNEQLKKITLHIPYYVFKKSIPLWKKYLLILLICFGQDLFPLQIIYGGSQNLYAQTQFQTSIKKGKGLKVRIRKRKTLCLPIQIDQTMTLGLVAIEPKSIMPEISLLKKKAASNADSAYSIPSTPDKNKRNPDKEREQSKLAFILPPGFKSRRKKT